MVCHQDPKDLSEVVTTNLNSSFAKGHLDGAVTYNNHDFATFQSSNTFIILQVGIIVSINGASVGRQQL